MHGVVETFRIAAQRLRTNCKWCGAARNVRYLIFGRHTVEVCRVCNCVITPLELGDL